MPDERVEALQREQAVRDAIAPKVEIGEQHRTVVAETKPAEVASAAAPEAEIMIPKYRYDEIAEKYNELKSQAKPEVQTREVESLIEQKLAPIKVQLEVSELLKDNPDFQEYAPKALERIKAKPSLTLKEAYQLEKFSSLESKAKEEGKNEAYQTLEKKSSLQAERSGRKTEQPAVEDLLRDKSVPLSEIAKMLPRE